MNAAPADQARLLDVADLDARLRQAEDARRNPPQAQRVQELLSQRQVHAQELAVRAGARDDLRAEMRRIESDVAVVDARRERDLERLNVVSNPKEAAGLEHELASLHKRKSDLEDAELEVMEKLELAEAAVAEYESVIAAINDEGARLSAEAKQAVSEAEVIASQLTRDREAVRASVPADLLAQFDRLATRSAGAALLRARTCTGCHMLLSGTDLHEIAAKPADQVVTCPECGCILVRTEESGL